MASGTVAAINRHRSVLAIRCIDGRYTLIRFNDAWTPVVGEHVEGDLTHLGVTDLQVNGNEMWRVEVQSFNCSVGFARDRLTR